MEGKSDWDSGDVHPAFVELLEEKHWLLPSTAICGIIPGCGTGYKVLYLAQHGNLHLQMIGLDVSTKAIELAKKYCNNAIERARNNASTAVISTADIQVDYKVGDFFTFTLPEGGYQVAFDMRFFCALPPQIREAWVKRYSEIISGGGELITLMFPIKPVEGGPPFYLGKKAYHQALDPYFDLIYYDANCKTKAGKEGDEYIGVWRRRHSD